MCEHRCVYWCAFITMNLNGKIACRSRFHVSTCAHHSYVGRFFDSVRLSTTFISYYVYININRKHFENYCWVGRLVKKTENEREGERKSESEWQNDSVSKIFNVARDGAQWCVRVIVYYLRMFRFYFWTNFAFSFSHPLPTVPIATYDIVKKKDDNDDDDERSHTVGTLGQLFHAKRNV